MIEITAIKTAFSRRFSDGLPSTRRSLAVASFANANSCSGSDAFNALGNIEDPQPYDDGNPTGNGSLVGTWFPGCDDDARAAAGFHEFWALLRKVSKLSPSDLETLKQLDRESNEGEMKKKREA